MKSIHEYIIKNDTPFLDSFKTENGTKLQGDVRFLADRLANRIADVVELPLNLLHDEIKVGYQVMVDPSIYYKQQYVVGGQMETPHTIDSKEGLYKLSADMIVLYREDDKSEWKGFEENLMVEFAKKKDRTEKNGIILPNEKAPEKIAKVLYSNNFLAENDIKIGDTIIVNRDCAIPFWIDGKEMHWLRNQFLYAKLN